MKFRLLQCFFVAFACIIGTCGVYGAVEKAELQPFLCENDQQCSEEELEILCPPNGAVAQRVVMSGLYQAVVYGRTSGGDLVCALKLNPNGSKCALRTRVFYVYDEATGQYVRDDSNYSVVPKNGYYVIDNIPNTALVDYCSDCNVGKGYYINDGECKECPTDINIGINKLYQFVEYGDGQGIESCAVQLNVNKSNCASGTNVVYAYNSLTNGYDTLVSNTVKVNTGYYVSNNNGLVDRCVTCPVNIDDPIGSDLLYQFIEYGGGQGIGSCAVQLNLNKSNCASGTNVVYAYNSLTNGYDTLVSNTVKVNTGYYVSNNNGLVDHCVACPVNEEAPIGPGLLYQFIEYGNNREGIASCAVRLNTDVSKCASGTNVVYKYNSDDGYTYNQNSDDYIVIPKEGYSGYDNIDSTDLVDHCGECDAGHGDYMENGQCKPCPLEGTNAEGKVGDDKRFRFTSEYGDDVCAVKLNLSKDNCGRLTNVVYIYNAAQGNYIRTVSDVFPDTNSVVTNPSPGTDDMVTSFCTKCGEGVYSGKPYNVNGECNACDVAGYYLYCTSGDVDSCDGVSMCRTCPAGSRCPGITANRKAIMCPKDTYSEDGAAECTPCSTGYSTELSGPADEGFNGLCLDRKDGFGVGCVSRNACKLTVSRLCITSDSCFDLPKNTLKIESTNRSVIKEMEIH